MARSRTSGVVALACVAALGLLGGPAHGGVIAYWVNSGQAGNQEYGGSLGLDFNVTAPITITQLGVFDDNSDGLTRPITVRLWDRTNTAAPLASLSFTTADPGTLVGGNRFKALASPITLPAGFQGTISADGYGGGERNGNGMGSPVAWVMNGGGGIAFVGSARHTATPGAYPTTLDSGPANRYASGTFMFSPAILTGNTAPGGFAILGAASDVKLWLHGGAGVESASGVPATDGQTVQFWRDQSGSNNHASQANAGERANYRASGAQTINGFPTLDFDAGDDMGGVSGFGAGISATYFVVGKISGIGGQWDAIFTTQDSGSGNNPTGVAMNMYQNQSRIVAGGTLTTYFNGAGGPNPPNDPGLGNPFIAVDHDLANSQNYPYRIANFRNNTNNTLNADLAEIVFFNRALNTAERLVISNALGAKYGIGLGADDRYAGDNPANGDYDLEVFGIGRVDAGNVVASAGAAGFGIQEANDSLGNGEWAFAGHRSPTNSILPNGNWERVWYVDVTGQVDAVLAFDYSDAGLLPPTSDLIPFLAYASTPALNFTMLVTPSSIEGDRVLFSLSGLQSGYYTLNIGIPEPGSLSLVGLGLVGLLARRRRRRAQR